MNVAIGILLIWIGAAGLWVAFHGTAEKTPWGAFTQVTNAINAQVEE